MPAVYGSAAGSTKFMHSASRNARRSLKRWTNARSAQVAPARSRHQHKRPIGRQRAGTPAFAERSGDQPISLMAVRQRNAAHSMR
jgi:hypothetical protein